MNDSKRVSAIPFFCVTFAFAVVSSFVHPITPAFLVSIHAPASMSGLAFATMSFIAFLFSPFWGKVGDTRRYGRVIALGYCCYALGQFVFSMATGSAGVLAGRAMSGFSNAIFSVNALSYLVSISGEKDRGRNLAVFATLQSVGAAIGYLTGGLIGDISLMLVFRVQIVCTLACAAGAFFLIKESESRVYSTAKLALRDVNPLASMAAAFKQIEGPLLVFLVVVFFASFGMTAQDNYFNYFLKDQLGFPPSYNGYIKAATGVIALVANSTINMWITKHTNTRKSYVAVLSMCSASLVLMLFVDGLTPFLATALLYYTFSVILLPLMQTLVMQDTKADTGAVSGLFNSIRTFGSAVGPTIAGLVYDFNPRYPFALACAAFAVAALLSAHNVRQYRAMAARAAN